MPIFSRMGLVHRHVDLYRVVQAAAAGLHSDRAALGLGARLLLIDRAVAAASAAGDRAQQHADQEKAEQLSKAPSSAPPIRARCRTEEQSSGKDEAACQLPARMEERTGPQFRAGGSGGHRQGCSSAGINAGRTQRAGGVGHARRTPYTSGSRSRKTLRVRSA